MRTPWLVVVLVIAASTRNGQDAGGEAAPKLNGLAGEKSPYLLAHARNPVDWQPWGDAAFAEAKRRHVPVFLSIGYSTCHWCHVMERESFENEEIARFLNEHFVCIKLDREERPDVDAVYMNAVSAFTRRAGWPATLFLTADRKPFFGGTYFPPDNFLLLAERVADLWAKDESALIEDADKITTFLRDSLATKAAADLPDSGVVLEAAESLLARHDPEHGGFGLAPKFPRTTVHELLLRVGRDRGRDDFVTAAATSLHKMARGGIRDHLAGGFHRYSTDEFWLVPHFEKMLYDQALIASTYLLAGATTKDESLLAVARDSLDALLADFADPRGGFHVGYDADSGGVEGAFYVWKQAELSTALTKAERDVVSRRFAWPEGGNFPEIPGTVVLSVANDAAAIAKDLGIEVDSVRRRWLDARRKLVALRSARTAPMRDDKVLTEWNGMAVVALTRGARILMDARYEAAARRALEFTRDHLVDADGRLLRRYRDGDARFAATLADEAWIGRAALDFFGLTGDDEWFAFALARAQRILAAHRTENGALLEAPIGTSDVLVPNAGIYDGATPSSVAVALGFLLRLHAVTGERRLLDTVDLGLRHAADSLRRDSDSHPALMAVLVDRLAGLREIVVVGDLDAPLRHALASAPLDDAVLLLVSDAVAAALDQRIPLLTGRRTRDGKAVAYVCRQGVCAEPTSDAATLRDLLH